MKKLISMVLALVIVMALAVPALAAEKKSLTLEDVSFSVAPVGVAKIQRQTEDWEVNFENVYVFDQDYKVFLKDGREFTDWSWAMVTKGLGDGDMLSSPIAQFSVDEFGVYSVGISTTEENGEYHHLAEVCNMTSKACLDTLIAEGIDKGITVDFQPMDEHVILAVPTANKSSLVVQGMAAVETMQYEGKSISVYSLPTTGVADFYPVGPVHSVTVSTTVVQDDVLTLKEGETPTTWEYTTEEAWNVYFAPDGTEAPNEIAIIEYKDNGELVATIGLRLASAEEQPTTPTQPEQPAAPAQAGTYTAKKYDTWGQLALNNYGTYGVWKQLMKANGNKAVKAGMEITLPEKLGSYTRVPAQTLAEDEQFYTVKAGDTLGIIAANYYGNVKRYIDIFNRNSDRLKNANMIYEGQILVLPAKK